MRHKFSFEINGRAVTVGAFSMTRLLDVLREELKLTGTKEGCGEGECGACSVFLDGELVNACLIPIAQVQGRKVTTIEGISSSDKLHPVQKNFLENNGAQCGICTPGMVMATVDLLEKKSAPTRDEICEGLSGNLCRCTGYVKIIDSVEKTIEEAQK